MAQTTFFAFLSSGFAVQGLQLDIKRETATSASKWGDWSCPCVGIDGSVGEMNLTANGTKVVYPTNVGTSCEAWDDGKIPDVCTSGGDPGKGNGFCAEKWCYVDPCTCDKSREKSQYMPDATFLERPLYYSYETCRSKSAEKAKLLQEDGAVAKSATRNVKPSQLMDEDVKKTCGKSPDEDVVGTGGCRCIGIKHHKSMKWELEADVNGTTVTYPTDTGNSCAAWEKDTHPECTNKDKSKIPKWCEEKWCYVDPCLCPIFSVMVDAKTTLLQGAKFEGHTLFYSYQTCGSPDHYTFAHNTEACANHKSEDECNGECVWSTKYGQSTCSEKIMSNYCGTKTERSEEWEKEETEKAGHKAWWQFW